MRRRFRELIETDSAFLKMPYVANPSRCIATYPPPTCLPDQTAGGVTAYGPVKGTPNRPASNSPTWILRRPGTFADLIPEIQIPYSYGKGCFLNGADDLQNAARSAEAGG